MSPYASSTSAGLAPQDQRCRNAAKPPGSPRLKFAADTRGVSLRMVRAAAKLVRQQRGWRK